VKEPGAGGAEVRRRWSCVILVLSRQEWEVGERDVARMVGGSDSAAGGYWIMGLTIRVGIKADHKINFIGSLPDFVESMRPMRLLDGKVIATIQPLIDRERPGGASSLGDGFTATLEFVKWDTSLIESSLDYDDPNTKALLKLITDGAVTVYWRLKDYFRNILRSWHDDPDMYEWHPTYGLDSDEEPQRSIYWLVGLHAEWLDDDGNWHPVIVSLPEGLRQGMLRIVPLDPVHLHEWRAAMDFIESGERATIRDELMANSWNLVRRDESRLAVIEAVIALESTILRLLAKAILVATSNVPNAPIIDQKKLSNTIEALGLRRSVDVGLTLVMGYLGLSLKDINNAMRAVEVRNNIVHQAQRNVDRSEAFELIESIDNIVKTIERWAKETGGGTGNSSSAGA
jgi:hypothetical protein